MQKDRGLGLLYLLLEDTRHLSYGISLIIEAWGATVMAERCGLISKSSMERILRYLDKREQEIKENNR